MEKYKSIYKARELALFQLSLQKNYWKMENIKR